MTFKERRKDRSAKSAINPKLRVIASPCRSGSTALLHAFSQLSQVDCYFQPVKSGVRRSTGEDFRIFYEGQFESSYDFIVSKESLGHKDAVDASYQIFPSLDAVQTARPVFIFRDPVETWNSWKRLGWDDFQIFKLAYITTYRHYLMAKTMHPGSVLAITLSQLINSPEQTLRRICHHWEITFDMRLVHWTQKPKLNVTIKGDFETVPLNERGIFRALNHSTGFKNTKSPIHLSAEEIVEIRKSPIQSIFVQIERIAQQNDFALTMDG